MMYQALYRKYRPRSFKDFIDQDNIKKILVNSIVNNRISHAYLFSGPRGIGKTSMAKIFAKAINCLDFSKHNDVCDECENCLEANNNSVDIIEIDAASNNGVDQIRDLKNKISIVPSKLRYKVYIIDEVHMLTNSAFNALLKTLEEPPSHAIFILATTEFYEVPETIVSRCQCFSFSRISMKCLEERLKFIAQQEKIDITSDAIKEIAHYSNGGLRDAIGMLDKLHSFTSEKITPDVFKNINGLISLEDISNFYFYIFSNNLKEILKTIDKIDEQGYDFKNFIEREMLFVRDKILDYYIKKSNVDGTINDNIELVSILNDILNRLKDAVNPIVIVQIYILKFIEKKSLESYESNKDDLKIISREIKKETNLEINNKNNVKKDSNKKDIKKPLFVVNEKNREIRINNSMATANINYKKDLVNIWSKLDQYFMDEKYGKIAQLLFDTNPMVVGSEYAILTTTSDGFINNIYANLIVVEDFIKMIYRNLLIVVVKNDEFEVIKNKYIEDKKNNIVYEVKKEYGKLVEESNSLINQAINVFGSDIVEIE